jgi:hypothetical protein
MAQIKVEDIQIISPDGRSWKGAAFSCSLCGAAISASLDPIAWSTDLVKQISKALGKG